jgi:hypothetical protein
MMEFLSMIEHLRFSQWVIGSGSIWAYPTIIFLHSVGMGMVAGINGAIDLRLVGLSPKIPIKPLGRLFPIMWLGFALNLVTGTMLLMADATTKLTNPDFGVKMVFVILGVVILRMMQTSVFGDPKIDDGPLSARTRRLAWISLACWVGAITAGRLLAYVGPVSGIPGLTNS